MGAWSWLGIPVGPSEDVSESSQRVSGAPDAASGLAGAISKTATAPLARLTILYQVSGLHLA
ncbi:hypothetical protein WJX84_003041, partial [Apatococcus fuscideae]